MREPLPEILPADPLPLLAQWLEEAKPVVKTPTAMALATVGSDGRPTVRMVICRGFDVGLGWLVFYSDRESTKGLPGRQSARRARLHGRFEGQAGEGPVTRARPDSDATGASGRRTRGWPRRRATQSRPSPSDSVFEKTKHQADAGAEFPRHALGRLRGGA